MEVETQGLKETAEQALIGLINSVADAAEFLKGEIPIAVQELLTYYTVYHAVWVLVSAILLMLTRPLWRWANKYADECEGMAFVPAIIIPIVATVCFFLHLFPLLKITLAPRIWLIEYAASLVK